MCHLQQAGKVEDPLSGLQYKRVIDSFVFLHHFEDPLFVYLKRSTDIILILYSNTA